MISMGHHFHVRDAANDFLKFGAVGALNFLIDFGVLNALMFFSGISSGAFFSVAKAVAYFTANTNSYFFNKRWTFKSRAPATRKEYGTFLFFSLIGALLNVGVSSLIVGAVPQPQSIGGPLWANIASLAGAGVLMIWNFFTYRTYVFRIR